MKELTITLPEHMTEYLESMSELTAETISEIIEDLVFNHFIKNLEIVDQDKELKTGDKTREDYLSEYKFLKQHRDHWPVGSKEFLMIHSRLKIIEDRLDVLGDWR